MRDHMMGWPAAMLAFEPEQKKQYITPTRSIRNPSDEWETKDFSYIMNPCRKLAEEEKKPESHPSPQPDAEGWIAHTPGPCPVAEGTKVQVKWAHGEIRGYTARNVVGWKHNSITHYRVVK